MYPNIVNNTSYEPKSIIGEIEENRAHHQLGQGIQHEEECIGA
jgi:hypothetical protein